MEFVAGKQTTNFLLPKNVTYLGHTQLFYTSTKFIHEFARLLN